MNDLLRTLNASIDASDVILPLLRLTAIGAAGHLALVMLRRAPAAARHVVATTTLALMIATPWLGAVNLGAPTLRLPAPLLSPRLATHVPARGLGANAIAADAPRSWSPRAAATTTTTDPLAGDIPSPPAVRIAPRARSLAPVAPPSDAPDLPWSVPAPPAWPEWPAAATALAAGVAAALLLCRLAAFLTTVWIARRAAPITTPRVLALLASARERLGMREPVEASTSNHVAVPAVGGFPRLKLLLPNEAPGWDDARLTPVLLHELAHVRRRDGIGLAVTRLATALLWFHPLAWTLSRAARRDCECACDDLVLGAGVRASDYADLLLSIARAATRQERWPRMSLTLTRPSSLEGRLLSILRGDVRRAPLGRAAALAVAFAVFALLLPLAAVRVVAGPAAARTVTRSVTTTATETRSRVVQATSSSESSSDSACNGESDSGTASGEMAGDDASAQSKSGEAWYCEARTAYEAERFDDAGEAYEQAARAEYRTGTAWYNAACSFARAGHENRAVGAFHEALDHGFDDASLLANDDDLDAMRDDRRFQMLLSAARQGPLAEVREGAVRGGDGKDASVEALLAEQKKPVKAEKVEKEKIEKVEKEKFEKVVKDSPTGDENDWQDSDPGEKARHYRSEGMYQLRHGDPARAARLFMRQYSADSTATALYNAACGWSLAGEKQKALDALLQSLLAGYGDRGKLQSDDDLDPIRHEKGFRELEDLAGDLSLGLPSMSYNTDALGLWRHALPRYKEVTVRHPEIGRAWFNLGLAQLRADEPEEGRQSYLRALAKGYRRKATLYNLACCAAQMGDKDEAFRRLDQAEAAGMKLEEIAPGDDDLDPLRGDARFRSLENRWGVAHREKAKKKNKDQFWED